MKKKIAIIENHIIATNTIRRKLTSELMEQGYDVTVLTTGKSDELQLARSRGFIIVDVKSSGSNPLGIGAYMQNIRKALKEIQPNVCLTFTIRPAIWGNMVTRRLHIPTITNITGIGPLFASNNPVYVAARMLYKFVLKRTAKIFFQNSDDRALFLKHGFSKEEKTALVPGSGVDHSFFAPMPSPESNKNFVFLFISRLVKDKGINEYVEAARMIRKDFQHAECRILGPLWDQNLKGNTVSRTELDAWIAEGVVKYLGETSDVRPFIAAADCIVLPSYREGTSNVLLEASSMERACITCNTTGCKEIVEDGNTGFLCKIADAADLSDKMKQMLTMDTSARIEMGRRARQKVIREFDKQIVVNAYLEAIREAII